MIKITNGTIVIEVSDGAYNDIYKEQGYFPLKDNKKPSKKPTEPSEDIPDNVDEEVSESTNVDEEIVETMEDIDEFSELLEKPVSNWSKDECITFAEAKGIDISECNGKEAKKAIKRYIDSLN